jgi:hypothetical protein
VPRQKQPTPVVGELVEEAPLAIPAAPQHREHEHRVDPYKSLPGAMPDASSPPKRKARAHDEGANYLAEQREKVERYDHYLDNLSTYHGDIDQALAVVYGVGVDQAGDRRAELLADVQSGIGSSSLGEIITRRDLSHTALVTLLRKWAYCGNPAASLKAIDMLRDMGEGAPSEGSFEKYARLALLETK